MTEIGINFWKADERTTTFSIAVADNSSGPFTTILDNLTSEIATVNTEQFFSLNNTIARYVKFIGIVSDAKAINSIDIYNVAGQRVLTAVGNGTFSKQIDVTQLEVGIYFIKLEGIGQTKFIIKDL